MTNKNHKEIFNAITSLLDFNTFSRAEIVEKVFSTLTPYQCTDEDCPVGDASLLRGEIGSVIDEMLENGQISLGKHGYYLSGEKPVILRTEACEREMIALLRERPMSKYDIRKELEKRFGTKKTLTKRDDNILYNLISKVIKRLENLGIITLDGGVYTISPGKEARLDDINSILAVKEEFLTKLHSRGGEFFEHYFMTLLGKYLSNHGKTVISNIVTGGTADGGIDGIIETRDILGFKEKIMVQMKNRIEDTNETGIRGFWGSVCAYGGTRGIFATTSGFHSAAKQFLDGIDNCVGIDGDMIFRMAVECLYGIKRRDGKYTPDSKVV